MLTLNVLFSLIVQAKITSTKRTGNGKILIRLLSVIADCHDTSITKERNMIHLFTDDLNKPAAYKKIDRLTIDFISTGNRFPADKITLKEFENKIGINRKPDWKQYRSYLAEMCDFCEDILDKEKASALVNTLLMLLKQDDSIQSVFYGNQFMHKNQLSGTHIHPKKICIEALLLGLLYHTLKKFTPADAGDIQLIDSETDFIHVIWLDSKESPVFWGDCSELMQILNPELNPSVKESLQIRLKPEISFCYPLEILFQNKKILLKPENSFYSSIFDYQEENHILLYASGGMGKSFLLQHQDGLYLSLAHYREEIREEINPEFSCWILIQILLKYHYHYAYQTYDLCTACEDEKTLLRQIAELLMLFKKTPENQIPEYTLLLDGMNEISPELQDIFAEELAYICDEWHNVRILLSSRMIPYQEIFETFEKLEITGIPEHIRDELLLEYPEAMRNEELLKILKTPLFMKYFLQNQGTHDELNTRGEILDAYFTNEIKKYEKPLQFIIKYAIPFLAHSIFLKLDMKRSDVSDAIEEAFQIYVHDERIYQNCTASDHFRKQILLKSKESIDFVELLIEKTGILTVIDNQLQFSHQYIYEYFAAKYILNAIHTVESNFTQETFERLLDMNWQYFDNNVYIFIGEICGDYRNIPDENGVLDYHRTALDTLLDMAREFHTSVFLNDIIRVMSFSRNRLICNVDFSRLFFSAFFTSGLKFSDNGNYPSDFRGCRIHSLPDAESCIFCATYSSDGKKLLLGMDDGHVFLYDVRAGRLLKDYNLHAYLKYPECFENIQFLNHDTQFTIATEYTRFLIETKTGIIFDIQSEKNPVPYPGHATALSPDKQHFLIDDTIYSVTGERKKIQFSERYNHFKNCDFRNIVYFPLSDKSEIQEILRKSGAVTD